ncbi:kinase-like domain-containing protein [Globomyces pollinis-pini]|nr:kinase-like domain-containing protein [Globomyces pollinis-pini]
MLKAINHPYINPYLGWSIIDNEAQVFTFFCEQGSLHNRIYQNSSKPGLSDLNQIRTFTRQIVSALMYLHSYGIVHRDIKPNNILLHNDECRITDLGSVRIQQDCCGVSHQKKISGTPAYCSPESIHNEIVYEAAAEDIWALGCLIYEMVLGQIPWSECDNTFAIYFCLGNLKTNPDKNLLIEQLENSILDKSGLDFVKSCFTVDPIKRPTAHTLMTFDYLK